VAYCCRDRIASIESAVEGEPDAPAVWPDGLELTVPLGDIADPSLINAWVKPDGGHPPGIDERVGISRRGNIVAFEEQNQPTEPSDPQMEPRHRVLGGGRQCLALHFASRAAQTRPPPAAAPRTRSISAIGASGGLSPRQATCRS
jgi:hypothetical protein